MHSDRKRPNRTTVNIAGSVAPEALAKLHRDVAASGLKTKRQYLEALIACGLPDDYVAPQQFASVVAAQEPQRIGVYVIPVLDAARDRLDSGEDMQPILDLLTPIADKIHTLLTAMHTAYVREDDARNERLQLEESAALVPIHLRRAART